LKSTTSGAVGTDPTQLPASRAVCEEIPALLSDCLPASAEGASTPGLLPLFSERSATPQQPATKSMPTSGPRSAQGRRAASSSKSYQREINLEHLPAVATPLNNQESLEEEVDARSKRLPAPLRSLPAAEPQQLSVRPRTKSLILSSTKQPKEPKDSPSSSRLSSVVHHPLSPALSGSAFTPKGQPSPMMPRRTSKLAKQSGRASSRF